MQLYFSSAKFLDLGVRSPAFLTKNWPLTIFLIFLTYSRIIWQSFFHTKNHGQTSPTGHQTPLFAVIKLKISLVAPLFGLFFRWPASASILPILTPSEWDLNLFFFPSWHYWHLYYLSGVNIKYFRHLPRVGYKKYTPVIENNLPELCSRRNTIFINVIWNNS